MPTSKNSPQTNPQDDDGNIYDRIMRRKYTYGDANGGVKQVEWNRKETEMRGGISKEPRSASDLVQSEE